jgi:hypothetical protein
MPETVTIVWLDPATAEHGIRSMPDGPDADAAVDNCLDQGFYCQISDAKTEQDALDDAIVVQVNALLGNDEELRLWMEARHPELSEYRSRGWHKEYYVRFYEVLRNLADDN